MPFELPPEIASSIPAEHLSHPSVQKYNSPAELIKGHLDLDAYRGRSIAMPNGESKPEDFDKWASEQSGKLKDHGYGITKLSERPPESPDKYEFKIEGVQDEQIKGDKILGTFRNAAHKLGINQSQAAGLFDVFAKEIYPAMQLPEPEFVDGEAAEALFKDTFKAEAPQAKQEFELAVNVISQKFPKFKDIMNDAPIEIGPNKFVSLGKYPEFIAIMTEVGKLMTQDFGGNINANTPAALDAQKEIEDIQHNKNNPKHDLWLRGDKATREYVDKLWAQTTGGR